MIHIQQPGLIVFDKQHEALRGRNRGNLFQGRNGCISNFSQDLLCEQHSLKSLIKCIVTTLLLGQLQRFTGIIYFFCFLFLNQDFSFILNSFKDEVCRFNLFQMKVKAMTWVN